MHVVFAADLPGIGTHMAALIYNRVNEKKQKIKSDVKKRFCNKVLPIDLISPLLKAHDLSRSPHSLREPNPMMAYHTNEQIKHALLVCLKFATNVSMLTDHWKEKKMPALRQILPVVSHHIRT